MKGRRPLPNLRIVKGTNRGTTGGTPPTGEPPTCPKFFSGLTAEIWEYTFKRCGELDPYRLEILQAYCYLKAEFVLYSTKRGGDGMPTARLAELRRLSDILFRGPANGSAAGPGQTPPDKPDALDEFFSRRPGGGPGAA